MTLKTAIMTAEKSQDKHFKLGWLAINDFIVIFKCFKTTGAC